MTRGIIGCPQNPFSPIDLFKACWISCEDKKKMDEFRRRKYGRIALDKDGHFVFFAESLWDLKRATDEYPDIAFHFSSEFKTGGNGNNGMSSCLTNKQG